MTETYNFQTPRDLYEKLHRDSEKLDIVVDGDYMFNFLVTAYHLQDWIKKSPLNDSNVIKRFKKRLHDEEKLTICKDIAYADKHFTIDRMNGNSVLNVEEDSFDALQFKNDIIELYEIYFKIKGHDV